MGRRTPLRVLVFPTRTGLGWRSLVRAPRRRLGHPRRYGYLDGAYREPARSIAHALRRRPVSRPPQQRVDPVRFEWARARAAGGAAGFCQLRCASEGSRRRPGWGRRCGDAVDPPSQVRGDYALPGREGRMLARIDGKQGVMGADGAWIVAPVYDNLKDLAGGTFAAGRDGKYGVLRLDGAWLIEPKYEDLSRLAGDRYAARLDGKYGVLLSDGRWLVEPSFEDVKPLTEDRIIARVGGMNGIYDTAAKTWVVEPRSAEMCGFRGEYAIGITDRVRTVYDARSGDMLIGPRYNRISLFFDSGLIAIRVDDRWGYADLSGKLVIPAQFRNMGIFRRGVVWGEHEGNMCPMHRRRHYMVGIPSV